MGLVNSTARREAALKLIRSLKWTFVVGTAAAFAVAWGLVSGNQVGAAAPAGQSGSGQGQAGAASDQAQQPQPASGGGFFGQQPGVQGGVSSGGGSPMFRSRRS